MSLLAIDLAPPACLRLDAPLRPFEPLRVLPALPRNSDCILLSISFFLLLAPDRLVPHFSPRETSGMLARMKVRLRCEAFGVVSLRSGVGGPTI